MARAQASQQNRLVAALAVALSGSAGCGSGKDAAPQAEPARAIEVAAPPGEIQTVALFGRWVAWGQATAAGGRDGPDRTLVYDLRDRRLRTVRVHAPGAIANLPVGTGRWLVQREIVRLPTTACGRRAPDCFSWALWSHDLRSGRERMLARSRRPAPQVANPIPVAAEGFVAWQSGEPGGESVIRIVRAAGGPVRTLARGIVSTGLSIDGGRVYFDGARGGAHPLLAVRITGGRLKRVDPGPVYRPAVRGGIATWLASAGEEGMAVLRRPVAAGSARAVVWRSEDSYGAFAIGASLTLVDDVSGLVVVEPAESRTLAGSDLDPAGRVSVDGSRVAFAERPVDATRSRIKVMDIAAGEG